MLVTTLAPAGQDLVPAPARQDAGYCSGSSWSTFLFRLQLVKMLQLVTALSLASQDAGYGSGSS